MRRRCWKHTLEPFEDLDIGSPCAGIEKGRGLSGFDAATFRRWCAVQLTVALTGREGGPAMTGKGQCGDDRFWI